MRRPSEANEMFGKPHKLLSAICTTAGINWYVSFLISVIMLSTATIGHSQFLPFVEVTDQNNPIVSDVQVQGISGAAWVDYDQDGWVDLFVADASGQPLFYHNNGGGLFTKITSLAMLMDTIPFLGVAWVDYDNDGDVDCMLSSEVESALFRNDDGVFKKLPFSHLGRSDTRGWSPAFADYDNDGNLDLLVTFARGAFSEELRSNFFVRSFGYPAHNFLSIDTGVLVTGIEKYKSANWSDYDQDGDMDLFIGVGPVLVGPGVDILYRNMLVENGAPGLERRTDAPLATDVGDGHMWDIIDYDNDGDLDAYRIDYGLNFTALQGLPNTLYRNDNGLYTVPFTGSISNTPHNSLSCSWGDCDNDGDLDCVVANQVSSDSYYINNGDGTFSEFLFGPSGGLSVATTLGDYDNDGDLDLLILGGPQVRRKLFNNKTNSIMTGAGWLKIKLQGTVSNRSAIGARVRAKATISGTPVWQMRTVSAQNTFLGHNSLLIHFGLGDATVVDSIIVEWPSGNISVEEAVAINQRTTITESGVRLSANRILGGAPLSVDFSSLSGDPASSWNWNFGDGNFSSLESTTHTYNTPGVYSVSLDVQIPSGDTTVTVPDYIAVHADTLRIESVVTSGGVEVTIPVLLRNHLALSRIDIPFSWSGLLDLKFESANTADLRSSELIETLIMVDSVSKSGVYRLDIGAGPPLMPGSGAVLNLVFSVAAGGSPSDTMAQIDIAAHSGYSPELSALPYGEYDPTTVSGSVIRRCCSSNTGNVDCDPNDVSDISDLTVLIDHLFINFPSLCCLEEANIDGDVGFKVDISDLTVLIDHLFINFPPTAVCP